MRRGRILIVVALILILCVVAAYFVTRGLGQGTGTANETQQAPDVAFIVKARLPAVEPWGYPPWAPDLAVEVLAHDDHPAETLEKMAQWLKAGVRLIWVVDSEKRNARVYRADGSEVLLAPDDTLDGEDVLPGFRCALSALW